jgi:hypothetical protein
MRKFYAITIALAVLLLSCSKKDSTAPDPDPNGGPDPAVAAAAKKLQKDVEGKWTFKNATLPLRVGVKATSGSRLFSQHVINRTGRILETAPAGDKTGFIEFLSDSTYMLFDAAGNYITGKFQATDGKTISLKDFGTLSEITFAQEKINFKITYSSNNKSITISANKAQPIPESEKAKLLSRKWYLTHEEDGHVIFEEEAEIYDDEGNVTSTFFPDSLNFIMSSSGTYVVETFEKGHLKQAQMANWKWHSTLTDRFVYWWYDVIEDEDRDVVIIRELTKDVFKATEYWIDDNSGEDIPMHWLLRPVK